MIATLVAVLLFGGDPEIAGDSACPTRMEVAARLAALAAPVLAENETMRSQKVQLWSDERRVHVSLLAADGEPLAERTIERSGTCADMAEAVAVVVSTWRAKLDPNVETPIVSGPAPQTPEPGIAREVLARPRQASALFDLGVGVLGALAAGDAAVGGSLVGCWRPSANLPGLELMLSGTSYRTQSVAAVEASADWLRFALSGGPDYRLGRGPAVLDVHLGAVLAVLHTRGADLWRTATDTSVQLGVRGGIRGLWVWNNAAAWIGLDVFSYPGQDRLTVQGYGEVGQMPHWETQIALGMSLGRFH